MKTRKEYKYYLTYYYLDKCENLRSGYSFIWATSDIKACAELNKIARNKHLAITNILSCEIIDERED